MNDHILTYSKIKFYPLSPIERDIHIEDIAHSLSLMTRANGHFGQFYSIAQHSLNCCQEAECRGYSDRIQLGCLLHDASESYISDLTRPVCGHAMRKTIEHDFSQRDFGSVEKEFLAWFQRLNVTLIV